MGDFLCDDEIYNILDYIPDDQGYIDTENDEREMTNFDRIFLRGITGVFDGCISPTDVSVKVIDPILDQIVYQSNLYAVQRGRLRQCRNVSSGSPLHLEHALIISKMTRYELEKYRHPGLNASQLEKVIRHRGSDYESLMMHHQLHKNYEREMIHTFNQLGIKTRTINRLDYSKDSIEWCDAVFPVGGDGTFLLAASRVKNNILPVIGFNSDPLRSEGFLCLPKKYSCDIKEAIMKLINGDFSWQFKRRIRITLSGKKIMEPPVQLHEQQLRSALRKSEENTHWAESERDCVISGTKTLPVLALNEVFVGESLSAQVSYFEVRLSLDDVKTKVKSSGLCISTGTGSTSWHLSMNRITSQDVSQILKCANVQIDNCSDVASRYNESLVFSPEDSRLCYTIRDLISAGVWPNPPGLSPRGFVTSLWLKSRCQDAGLVIDGGVSYPFNDGAIALMETYPEDSLRTVVF